MKVNTKCTLVAIAAAAALVTIGLGNLFLMGSAPAGEAAAPDAPSTSHEDTPEAMVNAPASDGLTPSVQPLYEIMGREADGTMVVRADFYIGELETRTRTRVRDGQTVQQVYDVVTPVRETVAIRVPPGKDVLGYLKALYEQRLEAGQPIAKAPVVNRVAEKQFEEVLFDVVEPEADGPATVEIECLLFKRQLVTRQLLRDGKSVEQFCVIPIGETKVVTAEVPTDIIAQINENPEMVDSLREKIHSINEEMPPEEVYEIIGQQPDGTTLVQNESVSFGVETRTREVVREGRTVEQVYELETPVKQLQTFELDPGQDIRDYLHEAYALEDATAVVPEAPAAPAADEDFPPPAPIVDPEA